MRNNLQGQKYMLDNLKFGVSYLFGKVNTITFGAGISGRVLSNTFKSAFEDAGIPCNLDNHSSAITAFNPKLSFPAGDLTDEQCENIAIALRSIYGDSLEERIKENVIRSESLRTEESQLDRILEHSC